MGSGIACFVIAIVDGANGVHPLPLTVTSYVPSFFTQIFEVVWGNATPFRFHSYVCAADGNVDAVKRTESPTAHIPGLELVSD
jgi:hypothetical protein